MMFLQAFLVGGVLCALFQIALMTTKLGVPKLLICGLALGGLGTAVGFCDWLAGVGGAGFSVMVVGAAQAIFNSLMALFSGVWLPICVVIAIFAALTVFGLVAGAIYRAMHKPQPSKWRTPRRLTGRRRCAATRAYAAGSAARSSPTRPSWGLVPSAGSQTSPTRRCAGRAVSRCRRDRARASPGMLRPPSA